MTSKFKLYDKVKDFASGYSGTITAIQLRAEGFLYSVIGTPSGGNQLPVVGDFPEARLELDNNEPNQIGFHLESN